MTERRNLALLACIECVRQDTGLEAVYEYRFHPVRKWRFDVACRRYAERESLEQALDDLCEESMGDECQCA